VDEGVECCVAVVVVVEEEGEVLRELGVDPEEVLELVLVQRAGGLPPLVG
jgi:hypothetical protein